MRHARTTSLMVTGLVVAVNFGNADALTTSADSIHALVAPALDRACASPYSNANDVAATPDGGFVVAGWTQISLSTSNCGTTSNGWIAKLASSGQVLWQEALGCGNSGFSSVAVTADGGFVVAGGTGNDCQPTTCVAGPFSSPVNCAWVVKLTASGRLQWQRYFSGAFQANASQIRQTSNGGYVVAGSTADTSGTPYAWVAALDPNGGFNLNSNCSSSLLVVRLAADGTVVWQRADGLGGHNDQVNAIVPTSNGGFVLAGRAAVGSGENAVLVRIDSTGAIKWQRRYDVGKVCYYNYNGTYTCADFGTLVAGIHATTDGGYVLVGSIETLDPADGLPIAPAWLLKTDAKGGVQWQRDYYAVWPATGLALGSDFYGVAQAGDGGFVAVGYREYYNLQADEAWVVRTDSSGGVGTCSEVHSANSRALTGGLTTSALALPVAQLVAPGQTTTTAAPASTNLKVHVDC
jgi:hypothetical protein